MQIYGRMSLYLRLWSQDVLLLIIPGAGSVYVAVSGRNKHQLLIEAE